MAKTNGDGFDRYMHNLAVTIAAETNVCIVGRAINVRGNKCDVEQLALYTSGKKRAPLIDVMIARPTDGSSHKVKSGDMVLVMFNNVSIENIQNRNYAVKDPRLHSLNDAFVIAIL